MVVAGLMGSPLLAAPCKADILGGIGKCHPGQKGALDIRVQLFHVSFMTAEKPFHRICLIFRPSHTMILESMRTSIRI